MSMLRTQAHRRTAAACRWKTPLVLFLMATVCTGTLLADRVELKTGEVFFGEILRADRREVSVRLHSGGIISFRMNQIAYFRKNYVPGDEWIASFDVDAGPSSLPDHLDTSFQASVSPSIDGDSSQGGISLKPSATVDESLVRAPVDDPIRGFRVAPPRGFLDWKPVSAIARFYDPVTEASLDIVSLGSSEASIVDLKNRTTRSQIKDVSNLRVVRDGRVRDVPYQGWLFEFKGDVNAVGIHQLQLFAALEGKALLLTYSSPERHFEDLRRAFAESIRSFAFTGVTDTEPVKEETPETPAEKSPEDEDPARELLRLLKTDRKTSEKVIDEFLKKDTRTQ